MIIFYFTQLIVQARFNYIKLYKIHEVNFKMNLKKFQHL